MPLTNIQIGILRTLASHRDPESYVAGGTPLNLNAIRYSSDIDVFHDREDRVAASAAEDAATLESAGYTVTWLRRLGTIYTANVANSNASTRLEWVVDSDFRFFPTIPDVVFGYMLHPVDLAMNKLMAAVGRRAVRDLVDLVTIHEKVLPLGAVIWAAVEKSPGFTPEGLIAEIRRNSLYPAIEWSRLETATPLDPSATSKQLRSILEEAEAFVTRMPSRLAGLLFLQEGKPVVPDPERLELFQTHAGQRRGQWPSSTEISHAMLEHYRHEPPS